MRYRYKNYVGSIVNICVGGMVYLGSTQKTSRGLKTCSGIFTRKSTRELGILAIIDAVPRNLFDENYRFFVQV